MKIFFLSISILGMSVIPCLAAKAQKNNLDNFFKDHIIFNSLGNFIEKKDVFIYDEHKKLGSKELNYEYVNDSTLQKINIVHNIPKVKEYLLLSEYIINENLAVISFTSANHKKYIIYTLKRTNSVDEWWYILSIYHGAMN